MSGKKRKSRKETRSLDDRFELDRALANEEATWRSKLWTATGKDDGESYLLHLFRKTGSNLDRDLERLLYDLVRRVRGVLATDAARDVLVEVVDVVADKQEIGLLLLGAGVPLNGGLCQRNFGLSGFA